MVPGDAACTSRDITEPAVIPQAALQRVLLGGQDDPLQFVTGHVNELTDLFQGLVQVLATDAHPRARQRIMGVVQVLRGGTPLG